jgi:DNA-damage-inducible protein J
MLNTVKKLCEGEECVRSSTAFTIFATKVSREQRIPFEVAVNPFYSKANMSRLKKAISDMEAGRNVSEHELIEADDE